MKTIYYQPEFVNGESPKSHDGVELHSFEVYHSKENAQKDFPKSKIIEYCDDDIEEPTYVDEQQTFTRDEVETLLFNLAEHYGGTSSKQDVDEFNEWMEENF